MTYVQRLAPGLLFLALVAPLSATADPAAGKALHAKNCVTCHASLIDGDGSRLYTRPDRRVNSLGELERQVRRCRDNLGVMWFDEEVENVVQYLDAAYYHFQDRADGH